LTALPKISTGMKSIQHQRFRTRRGNMIGLFKMGLTVEKAASKIVFLQDKTVPQLKAALEQAKQVSLGLRKNRIMGEEVAEKQIQEADRAEENIQRELTATESAIDDLTGLLRDMKVKENARKVVECQNKMDEHSREARMLNEKILKAAAAFKAVVFERDGLEMPVIFAGPIATTQEEDKIFNDEFKRLVPKEKCLDIRKRENFELFQALRAKTATELADVLAAVRTGPITAAVVPC
ncbi:MAG: hypothetical protein HQL19_08205, partial [Candidatus Omnitrophica bacterium]|nr:hypothetical protein [Candidatus Omnitrophota bacterium]